MEKVAYNVGKNLCAECSLALRRFIGNMDGVESIGVEDGKLAIEFDMAAIEAERLDRLVRDSLDKLGYRLKE